MRDRRGALSVGLLVLLVAGAAGLPIVAHYGGIPGASEVGLAHELAATQYNESVRINDNSSGANGFNPSTIVVTARSPILFQLYNNGTQNHTFTLYALANGSLPCAPGTSPSYVTSELQKNGTLLNIALAPGEWFNTSAPLNFSHAADYEFLSAIPYQCQNPGFTGSLTVLPAGSHSQQVLYTNATAETTFVPNILVAEPGIPIVFMVGTSGGHTFTLNSTTNYTGFSPGQNLPSSVPTGGNGPAPGFPVNLNLANAGTTYEGGPVIMKPGIYWFVCTVSGHFAAGMWGKLYVGVGVSLPALTPSITNVIQIGYLLVAAVVIGGAGFLILMGMNEPVPLTKPGDDSAPHEHHHD